MSNRLYLVTGAAGFLGSTVVRQLVEKGERVRAFDLPGARGLAYLPKEAEICEGDLLDQKALDRFFTVDMDTELIVLHVASIVTVDPDYNKKVMQVNIVGTKNIIQKCVAYQGKKKLVYCSSTGAIPETKGGAIKEVHDFTHNDPDKVVGCYSVSKALATQEVLNAVRDYKLDACVVHPSGIMGPEDNAIGETTGTLIKIINGEMTMGIDGSFNLCDVRDLADGMLRAAERGRAGECYILGNEEVRFKDFAGMITKEAGCKSIKMFLPINMANFFAKILEKQAKKKGQKPLMTTFSIYNLARNNNFDSSKAKAELGYTTRSYQETIHDEIVWLKQTGTIA